MTRPTPNATREAVELLPVTQADRVLVARFIRRYDISENASRMARNVLVKNHDDSNAVQEAAAHRLQSASTPSEERRKALEEAASLCDDRAAGRQAMYDENGASINAHKAVEAEEIAAAIRSLSAAPTPQAGERDGWKPIETAPRDGSWFMTINADYAGHEPEIEVGAYNPYIWPEYVEVGDGLYRKQEKTVYEWRGFNNFRRATHWRPLPEPPAEPDTSGYAEWADEGEKGDA